MSRFHGYVGLRLYGRALTASEQGLAPVLRDAAQRGLIYVDDGSSSRSVAMVSLRAATICRLQRPISCSKQFRLRLKSTERLLAK
jgi:polysaccharide deacetylase 2 family uncharacterized protein YibQ